jgi:tetratricopeptide (TPR) repeat protein
LVTHFHTVNRFISLPVALFLLLAGAGQASAASMVEAVMSSRFLVRGEVGTLELLLPGEVPPDAMPDVPVVKDLVIRRGDFGIQRRMGPGRRTEYFIPFSISSYEVGTYIIPGIELSFDGVTHRTSPVELRIIDDSKLTPTTITVGSQVIRYYAAFHALKDQPFIGEKQPVELKIYFPEDVYVIDWGIPEFERDGLSAWRFQPQPRLERAPLAGRKFASVSYPSTVSTNRAGQATLGPATLNLQLRMISTENFGGAFIQQVPIKIPAIQFDSKPLPPGAPEGFDNAIGSFDLRVRAGETEIREGDPITLEMTVRGSGNLDALSPPELLDADGWKLYDASAAERGEERRELAGEVTFRQFMRPLRPQRAIPPFRLVYFDPAKESYETLLSDAIPLNVLPSTNPGMTLAAPQAMPIPLEEMTDILGVVNGSAGLISARRMLPPWIWQLIPALVALGLIVRIALLKLAPRLRKDPDLVAREREWKEVERAPGQSGEFYRRVGHFIERWLGDRKDSVIAEVLAKRDEVCFRQETADAKIDRSERQRVLRQLRRIALPLLLLAASLSGDRLSAAEDAQALYNEGRYDAAAKAWLDSGPYEQLPPDTLFNIGNASYRLGSPGEAALYYRRALERDPGHPEARQNLRFLERKFGSITVQRPDYQHQLARVPLGVWQGLVWASAWIVGIGLLVFPATCPGAGVRIAAIAGFVSAPLLAVCGLLAWRHFPDDARFAPAKEQVVIIADSADVRTDAARTAPKVIDAPAGSLCRILTRSGEWAYVAFTNDSRGWVPLVDIRPLLPETTPEPPRARPVAAGEPESDA